MKFSNGFYTTELITFKVYTINIRHGEVQEWHTKLPHVLEKLA
jgi:hypothetical protein